MVAPPSLRGAHRASAWPWRRLWLTAAVRSYWPIVRSSWPRRQPQPFVRRAGWRRQPRWTVTDFAAVDGLVRETAHRTGRLDFMFNNAGIGVGGPLERQTADDWRLIVDVNLLGVANGVQAAIR